jgi:hypothetical protein
VKHFGKAVEAEKAARQTLSYLIAGADRASGGLTSDQDMSRGVLPKAVIQPQGAPLMRGKILGTWCANSTGAADLQTTTFQSVFPAPGFACECRSDQGL